MNTVATMGIAGNALCKLPLGILLDKFGPRATAVVGALMVMFGSLLLGPPKPSPAI
jgi:nitrate/nitrite transporter NarK